MTDSTIPYAARYLVPYLRPFPIWRYGERYSRFDGTKIDDGWYPDVYGQREVSRAEAERLWRERQKG